MTTEWISGPCPRCGYDGPRQAIDREFCKVQPKTLNILIIGAGSAGQRHARMLRERGHVCSFYDPPMGYGLFSGKPNAVVIASPPETHEQYLQEYGQVCPILCEGPVTYYGGSPAFPHMTASNWLFIPQVARLKVMIQHGLGGQDRRKPVSAHLWFDYDLAKWRGEGWDYKRSCYYDSGIDLINCHEAMTALQLFGAAEQVERIATHTGKSKGLDAVSVVVKHASGVLTTISSGWHSAKYQRGIRVVFEDGSCEEVGWTSPQDDAICNQSYQDMISHWLKAIETNNVNVRPSLLDGYRAYRLMQGEVA